MKDRAIDPNVMIDPKRRGRPFALMADRATLRVLLGLGAIQTTTREVAAVFGVSHDTLLAFLRREQSAAEAFEMGKEQGKVSLRRLQFALAKKNAAMAIFLGKNFLGQRDQPVDPRAHYPDLRKLTDDELDTVLEVFNRAAARDNPKGPETQSRTDAPPSSPSTPQLLRLG